MSRRVGSSLSEAGLRLLEKARTPEQVEAALEAIPVDDPGLRPALLRRYQGIAAQNPQRDQAAAVRTALLRAVRAIARTDDVALLEAALWTYEFMPNPGGGRDEVAGSLRGVALIVLNDVDPGLAAYHAARLLTDPNTSRFNGEPALTAVRVLSQQEQVLPLYAFAVQAGSGEMMGECLRALAAAPTPIVRRLVDAQLQGGDEIALVGAIDLLLAHPDRQSFTPILRNFLNATTLIDVYRYGVTAMVATRREDLRAELQGMVVAETRSAHAGVLRDALRLYD